MPISKHMNKDKLLYGKKKLPTFIAKNLEYLGLIPKDDSAEIGRVLRSIDVNSNYEKFDNTKPDLALLRKAATAVNSSLIHCSGNCAAISTCLLFNLKLGGNYLACQNIWPLYDGANLELTQLALFENQMQSVKEKSLHWAEKRILKIFKEKGERYFGFNAEATDANPLNFGHSFNAVVVGEGDEARVVYIDAWRKTNQILTAADISKRYRNNGSRTNYEFTINYYQGNLPSHADIQGANPVQPEQSPDYKRASLASEVERVMSLVSANYKKNIYGFFEAENAANPNVKKLDFSNLNEFIKMVDALEEKILADPDVGTNQQNRRLKQCIDEMRDATIKYVHSCLSGSPNEKALKKYVKIFVANVAKPMNEIRKINKAMLKTADDSAKPQLEARTDIISKIRNIIHKIFRSIFPPLKNRHTRSIP